MVRNVSGGPVPPVWCFSAGLEIGQRMGTTRGTVKLTLGFVPVWVVSVMAILRQPRAEARCWFQPEIERGRSYREHEAPLLARNARNGAPGATKTYGVILKTTPFRLSMFEPPFGVVP